MSARTYSEPLVARVTGINKKVIAQRRRHTCLKKVDWMLLGGVVHFTDNGLKKICRELSLDAAAFEWPAEAPPKPAAPTAGQSPPPPQPNPPAATDEALLDGSDDISGETGADDDELERDESPAAQAGLAPPPQAPPSDQAAAPAVTAAAVIANGVTLLQRAGTIEATVTRTSPNPTIVLATIPGRDREVRVRVRDNANFIRGLVLRVTSIRGYADFFNFAGRLPRWRGDRVGFTPTRTTPATPTAPNEPQTP